MFQKIFSHHKKIGKKVLKILRKNSKSDNQATELYKNPDPSLCTQALIN